jgi:hypothetical protein
MSGARVQSVDALKYFRIALWKFKEAANVALGDAEGEVQRTVSWLQGEQQMFWQGQIRKRHEHVNRCKEAVRQKQIFKDSTGRTQSAVDELKALGIATKRLEEAEQKLINTKRHSAKLQKELHMYKGAVQGFATVVAADLPNAVASLDRMVAQLEAYLSLTAPTADGDPGGTSGSSGVLTDAAAAAMTRSEFEAVAATDPTAAESSTEGPPQAAVDSPDPKEAANPNPG